MNRKLMICPWFGPLPDWFDLYLENIGRLEQHGYTFLFDHDLDAFRQRVGDLLGVRCPIEAGSPKIQDYRPAFGMLYEAELAGYEWWGHTDLDCVYGRVEQFVTDELLEGCDIQTDNGYDYLCGPWTLYLNVEPVVELFLSDPSWLEQLENPRTSGWVEMSFTETARNAVTIRRDHWHAHQQPAQLARDGDRLLHEGREITFFHFRYTKEWPLP